PQSLPDWQLLAPSGGHGSCWHGWLWKRTRRGNDVLWLPAMCVSGGVLRSCVGPWGCRELLPSFRNAASLGGVQFARGPYADGNVHVPSTNGTTGTKRQ